MIHLTSDMPSNDPRAMRLDMWQNRRFNGISFQMFTDRIEPGSFDVGCKFMLDSRCYQVSSYQELENNVTAIDARVVSLWGNPVPPPSLKPDPLLTRIRRAPAIYRAYRSLGRPWWKAAQRTIQMVLG